MELIKTTYEKENTSLHNLRTVLDPIIYKILDDKYGKLYDTFWINSSIPSKSNKTIFITERRKHPNLKFVLRNVHYYCPDYSINIHCSKENYEFVKEICQPHTPLISVIFEDDVCREQAINDYNNHHKSLSTWESIDSEHILVIQTDTYLRKHIPCGALEYDYMGSSYTWTEHLQGGGLSLRKKSVMVDICQKFAHDSFEMEDTYAYMGAILCEYKTPSKEEIIFTESCMPTEDTVGVHQWWTFIASFIDKPHIIELFLRCDIRP
jgi:hypothetical protein